MSVGWVHVLRLLDEAVHLLELCHDILYQNAIIFSENGFE
jgi:hypothetical protein